jgi:hypothetical protein
MRALFSEFSYGFALTNELVERHRHLLVGAPHLPSQNQEGRPGGGYDVGLPIRGFPLFLQFKVSEYMLRSTAGEWKKFGKKYFRFQLHPLRHSVQHHLLIDLESRNNCVYYAVPAFYKAEDLNQAFSTRTVVDRTVFVRPSDIGRLPDEDNHCIAFLPGERFAYLFSEYRKEVPIAAQGHQFAEEVDLRRRRTERAPRLDHEFLETLARTMTDLVSQQVEFEGFPPVEIAMDLPPVARIGYLARTFFGAELLWVRVS